MVEEIIGKQAAADVFFSSMLSSMVNEKTASDIVLGMEKRSKADLLDWLKGIGGAASHALGFGVDTAKAIPPTLGWLALLGASAGGLGAMGFDVIKDRVSKEDPEAKFNEELEATYAGKERESKDAKWMSRVRSMRDELKRGYRKMTSSEYAKKYKELVSALDEKRSVA